MPLHQNKEDYMEEVDKLCLKIAKLADKGNGTECGILLVELRRLFKLHEERVKEEIIAKIDDMKVKVATSKKFVSAPEEVQNALSWCRSIINSHPIGE